MTAPDLGALRQNIDQLDEQIQTLVTRRAEVAREVARAKYAAEPQPDFYRPEREREVLRKALARNRGPLPDEAIARLFQEIMSACLALQRPLSVAYLGPEGTYSQAAVLKHFGHAAQALPVRAIEEVFREVEADSAQYGVVPVENSTEGGVNQTLDMFMRSSLGICSEIALPIHNHLLSLAADMGAIRRIYSHQQPLAQCRLWLDTHLPNVERIAVTSNAEAAQRALKETDSAAIAGQIAAERYQLRILAARIEDEPDNTTRFAVLGKQKVPPTGEDKTSLLLSAPNRPGALYNLLSPIAENGLSMTRIESRPSRRGMWDYVFFIDIEGHWEDPAMQRAVTAMRKHSAMFKHLGSYPRALL